MPKGYKKFSKTSPSGGNYSLDLCGFPNGGKIILSPETIRMVIRERERLGGLLDRKIAEIMRLLEAEE